MRRPVDVPGPRGELPGLAAERTALAWDRTAVALLINGALLLARDVASGGPNRYRINNAKTHR